MISPRIIFLKFLKIISFDFKINHHYTKFPFELNLYKHKGYWYYGKKREKETVDLFYQYIKPNQNVIEIGGHIGYFSTLFSSLVGDFGKVLVFEPSKENLIYLEKNIKLCQIKNVEIINKGAGDFNGELEFYIDPITGQNNSFVKDFSGYFANREFSAEKNAPLKKEKVQVVKVDSIVKEKNFPVNFIKIDVEGFEKNVIIGMKETLKNYKPNLMIEIQKDEEWIIDYFLKEDYNILNEKGVAIRSFEEYIKLKTPNIFFINEK